MNTKLTLTVQRSTVEKAKQLAKSKGRSLSDIVENYLKAITSTENFSDASDTPITNSIIGSVKAPENFDYKKIILEERSRKYFGE